MHLGRASRNRSFFSPFVYWFIYGVFVLRPIESMRSSEELRRTSTYALRDDYSYCCILFTNWDASAFLHRYFRIGRRELKMKICWKKSDFVIFDRNGNWRVWTFRVTSFFCYLYFFRSCTRKVHPLAAKSCQISIRSTIVQQSLSKDSTQWSPTLELQFVFINILFIYMRVISTRSHKRSWIN